MKIFDFFRRETKQSQIGSTLLTNPGQPIWTPRDYSHFANEAYTKNVVAYQSINRIADACASVRWGIWRGETELSAHPLLDLIDRPNPAQSWSEFVRAKVGFYLIAGNSYDERIMSGGRVAELYTLRPDRMKVIPSTTGLPAGYIYTVNSKSVTWDADTITGDSDVRHMKAFHPLSDWYGLSPIEAGAYAVDQHNEAMQWMQALLQNSAQPSGALTVSADRPDLSDDQFNRLKNQIETEHQGAKNAGRPLLLEGGMDWKQMGLSPQSMQIIESKYSSARDVSLAFGVPPMMLGIPGDNTYSNYSEARLSFWEDTVIPLIQYIGEEWSNWLGDGTVEFRADLDGVPSIVDKRASLWEMANRSADLTINERRELKGYPPIPGGEVREAVVRNAMDAASGVKSINGDHDLLKALAYGR